jgi:hypothetical protein
MARKKTPAEDETRVLEKSARHCALCFYLIGDLTEKHGQLAHYRPRFFRQFGEQPCFSLHRHHSLYDSKTSQHKNYTEGDLRRAKTRLYTSQLRRFRYA